MRTASKIEFCFLEPTSKHHSSGFVPTTPLAYIHTCVGKEIKDFSVDLGCEYEFTGIELYNNVNAAFNHFPFGS